MIHMEANIEDIYVHEKNTYTYTSVRVPNVCGISISWYALHIKKKTMQWLIEMILVFFIILSVSKI